jgi:hypothetical protein
VKNLSLSARAGLALPLAASAVLLGACASSFEASQDRTSSVIVESLPKWAGGEPASVPRRLETPPAYPAVNAPVAPRTTPALSPEEQSKAVAELVAARNRAAAQGKAAHKDEDIAVDEGLALARGKYARESSPPSN